MSFPVCLLPHPDLLTTVPLHMGGIEEEETVGTTLSLLA